MARHELIHAWQRKHTIKANATPNAPARSFNIKPGWISTAHKDYRARSTDADHVEAIIRSLETKGIQPTQIDIRLVMIYPAHSPPSDKVMSGDWEFDGDQPPFVLAPYIGSHSTEAFQRLHETHGDSKPQYALVPVREILVLPDTPDNMANLRFIGTMDNTVKGNRLKMSMVEAALQLRNSYMYMNEQFHTKEQKDKYWKTVITDSKVSMPFTGGSFSTIAAMAQREDVVWAELDKVFKGHVKHNKSIKQVTPTALTHFDAMGNIPVDNVVKWLQRIVNGEWDTSTFKARCIEYKKKVRVVSQILEYVATMDGNTYSTYEEVCEVYPSLAATNLLNSIVHACGSNAKDDIPKYCIGLIDAGMAKDRESKHRAVSQVPFLY